MALGIVLLCLTAAATTSAHGHATGLVANGQYFMGYSPNFQYMKPVPKVPAWSAGGYGQGGIAPDQFGKVCILKRDGTQWTWNGDEVDR
jgi:cellulase